MRFLACVIGMLLILGLLSPQGLAQTAPPPLPGPPAAPAQVPPSSEPTVQPEIPFFGQDLLARPIPTGTEALERAISAKDYHLGPGDRILISIWRGGKPPNQFNVTVPLEGRIFLPILGEMSVAGDTLDQARRRIARQLALRLPGFSVSILLTGLRSFKVLVLGEVEERGYITVTAVTRVSEVLAAARVNRIGSIRNLELRAVSGRMASLDLYRFLASGSLKDNPVVTEGQIISVPPRYGAVEIRGAVGRPGRYEIKKGETLNDVLRLAGGLNVDAYRERAELSRLRVQSGGAENREVITVNFDRVTTDTGSSQSVLLKPDDILTVYSLSFFRGGKVRLTGSVRQPGEYELVSNMRLRDLLFRSGGLLPDADLERAQLERILNNEKTVIPVNLAKLLLDGDETQNLQLQFEDTIIIPSLLAVARIVFVEGRVTKPGGYPWRENETVSTLLVRAGGVVLEGASEASTAATPLAAPADLKAAFIERTSSRQSTKLPVDLHRLIVERDQSADVSLQPGDVLVVPARLLQVYVQGTVERAGAFPFEPNRTVRHYIGLAAPRQTADLGKLLVRRLDGSFTGGLDTIVQSGDVIIVSEKQAWKVLNVLGIVVPLLSVIFGK